MVKSFQTPDFYDNHGNPKPFFLFWLSCFILVRAWVLFAMAGVTHAHGSTLLNLFYPQHSELYFALALSFPVILLMFLAGNLHKMSKLAQNYWRYGKVIMLAVLGADLAVQITQLFNADWSFHPVSAITLVISGWLLSYVVRSRRFAWLFKQ